MGGPHSQCNVGFEFEILPSVTLSEIVASRLSELEGAPSSHQTPCRTGVGLTQKIEGAFEGLTEAQRDESGLSMLGNRGGYLLARAPPVEA